MQLPILIFDIETITDVETGCRMHGLDCSLPYDEALQALQKLRRQESGSDFPRLPLHEIVCLSGLWVDAQHFQLFSWSRETLDEVTILQKFIGIFEKRRPTLVTWNGAQFDIPVILHRCLYYGLSAPRLFDEGELDRQNRYDNYQNRYHLRHSDMMDLLAHFNMRNVQRLDDLAQVLGLPGKGALDGQQVSHLVMAKQWSTLVQYCEGDVINTWLIYLRWSLVRGFIDQAVHQQWVKQTIDYIRQQPQQAELLSRWQQHAAQTLFTHRDFQVDHLYEGQSHLEAQAATSL